VPPVPPPLGFDLDDEECWLGAFEGTAARGLFAGDPAWAAAVARLRAAVEAGRRSRDWRPPPGTGLAGWRCRRFPEVNAAMLDCIAAAERALQHSGG
jgi:hypothetical protein